MLHANLFIFSALSLNNNMATFGGLKHLWANALWLTSYYPCMTFDPTKALHLVRVLRPTKFASHKAFLDNLTPGYLDDLCMTFHPSNALQYVSQEFFLPNLVAIGHISYMMTFDLWWGLFEKLTNFGPIPFH